MDNQDPATVERIPITYGEFYDYPRQIRFQFKGQWFYLGCDFDDKIDDYPDTYDVYLLPFRSQEEINAKPFYWTELTGDDYLGQIIISDLGLDESKRRSVDAHAFAKWLAARSKLVMVAALQPERLVD